MKFEKLTKMVVLCILSFVLGGGALYAQVTVSGTLTDNSGQPVLGATVLVVGTMNGTQTDLNGRWSLQVSNPSTAVIQFSCLGYETVEESLNNRAVINVVMPESSEALEEVVFVGYGTQKKVNLTGSVSAVNFSDISDSRTIITTSQALAGLAPGLDVRQTSAQPGAESTTIRIRGTGSFTSSASNPLVLVDGVEWSMDAVNPSDIESITVLKDAASTAIYGTRASNGVILITTKTGGAGDKIRISYTFNGDFQTAQNKIDWVNDYCEYMELLNESYTNFGRSAPYSQATMDLWAEKSLHPNDVNEYGMPNYMAYPRYTDWFDLVFNTGFTQEHNLSISGGSNSIRYLISGSYLDDEGVMTRYGMDSGSQKGTFRVNLDADVTKWFTIGTKIFGQIQTQGLADISSVFSYLRASCPGIWPGSYDAWGYCPNPEEPGNPQNPFIRAFMTQGTHLDYRLNGTVYAKIRPYKGISIEASLNYAPHSIEEHTYHLNNGEWDYQINEQDWTDSLSDGTMTDYNYRSYRAETELLARYEAVFKKEHAFSALVGYSTLKYETWAHSVSMKGATDWTLTDGSTYSTVNGASFTPRQGYSLRSYFARVNYAFKDRYLFEANVRVDGSSVFGSNNRYGAFPSFSAGWKIHEEPWMASANDWLSELKLRASWGETGNNQGIGYYSWQSTYNSGGVVQEGSPSSTLYISSMSNYDLKWETTATLDIGVDAGFFKNKLTAEIDYYKKDTRDILYTPSTYLTMGDFSSVAANLGKMWNQGFELALNWKQTVKDFYYYVGVNFSFNKNKVTKFKGKLEDGWANGEYYTNFSDVAEVWNSVGYILEDHPIGDHYIYKLYNGTGAGYSGGTVDINAGPKDGMIRTETDMAWVRAMVDAGYTFVGGNTISKDQLWYGDFIYADLNGDGDYGNSYDRYFTGHSSVPSINLGITLGLAWKGLEFSMIWSGAFDYYLNWFSEYYNSASAMGGYCVNRRIADDHYYYDPDNPTSSKTNLTATYTRLVPGHDTSTSKNFLRSDFYEYKSDYMKLRNVTLAYTIPQKWTRKWFVNQLKFFVSGENLLTITKFNGIDPEIGASQSYPLMKQYTIGAQITF